jgi:hypothetical protein
MIPALLSLALQAKKPAPQPAVDVSSYKVKVDLDVQSGAFTTTTTVTMTPMGELTQVTLDTHQLEVVKAGLGQGGADVVSKLEHQPSGDDKLVLTLPTAMPAGAPVVVTLVTKGMASEDGSAGLIKLGGQVYFAALGPAQARRLFPCHDALDDKADIELEVALNGEGQVLGSLPTSGDDKKKFTFKSARALAPSELGFVVGKFDQSKVATTPPLTVSALSDLAKDAEAAAKAMIPGSAVLTKGVAGSGGPSGWAVLTDAPWPAQSVGSLGVVRSEGVSAELGLGALATQALLSKLSPAANADAWLLPALGIYLGQAAQAEATRSEGPWVRNFLEHREATFRDEEGRARPLAGNPDAALDDATVARGVAVVRMLATIAGREPFEKAVSGLFAEHPNGQVSALDLISAVEHTISKDLTGFRKAWLDQPGFPILKVQPTWLSGDKKLALTIAQRPARAGVKSLYQGTLVVVVHRASEPSYDLELKIPLAERETVFGAELPAAPEWINWNKGESFYARIEATPKPEALQALALQDPDPLARLWALLDLAGALGDSDKKGAAPSQAALGVLVRGLQEDHSAAVRAAVLTELGHGGARSLPAPLDGAISALAITPQGLGDDADGILQVKAAAMALLGRVDSPSALSLLQKTVLSKDAPPELVQAAAQGLGRKGDDGSIAQVKAAFTAQVARGNAFARAVLAGLGSAESDAAGVAIASIAGQARGVQGGLGALLNAFAENRVLLRSKAGLSAIELIATNEALPDGARARAVSLLGEDRSAGAKALLNKLLKNTPPEVQSEAKAQLLRNK